jgi:heme/copper-type cytochrome/quinol oxidase subunit 1
MLRVPNNYGLSLSIKNKGNMVMMKCQGLGMSLTFIPMHYLSFAVLPRRILDFPDSINCWNSLSSLGCSLT